MNNQPATPARRTRKASTARSAARVDRVPIPATDATNDEIFEFSNYLPDHQHIFDQGLELFEWARDRLSRYETTGELPETRLELLSFVSLLFRMIRFEAHPSEYDELIEERAQIARLILTKLHGMKGESRVDSPV
jgi:hypothetical protein